MFYSCLCNNNLQKTHIRHVHGIWFFKYIEFRNTWLLGYLIFKDCLNFMYVYECLLVSINVYHIHAVRMEVRSGCGSPLELELQMIGRCRMGAWSWTRVLCKSRWCFEPLSHLSSYTTQPLEFILEAVTVFMFASFGELTIPLGT